MFHQLVDGAHFTAARARIRITKKAVGGKRHAVAQASAQDLAYRDAPGLPQNVEAREFQGGQDLGPVIVK